MTNFNIQIISDTICPWCYIGYRRLTRAITTHISSHPLDKFTITWSPFYLNSASPAYPGADKQAFYESKFGKARTLAIFQKLGSIGEEEGIKFSFGGNTGRTRDSHRVLWLAGNKERELEQEARGEVKEGVVGGVQTRVVERLFRAYFEEEKNITQREVLVEAAVGGGLDKDEVEKLLDSEDGGKEVDEEAEGARRQFVTGVPYFMVQGQYAIEGADEPATFLDVFEKIKTGADA